MGVAAIPYRLEKRASKWCVVGPNRTHGCHETREKAIRQQRALYRNAPESAEGDVTMTTSMKTATENPPTTWTVVGAGGVGLNTLPASGTSADMAESEEREPWSGILGTEWSPTGDGRILELGQIFHRELPVPFSVQIQKGEGHDGAFNCGRIEMIEWIPLEDFKARDDAGEFDLSEVRDGAMIIWGEGSLDGSEYAEDAKRLLANGSGVSLDGLRFSGKLFDKEDLSEIDQKDMDMGDLFEAIMMGTYLQGVSGKIAGVTVVDVPAFEEAKVLVASAQLRFVSEGPMFVTELTAAAGPVKPPTEWFQDPKLDELTPLTITEEGRVYGHLADWGGCHVGFQGICVPPFRSASEFAFFNCGQLETAEGELVNVGKIMFSMKGAGHAPTDGSIPYQEIQSYYDKSTNVGAFVRAGSDHLGTWLAGALRPGLSDIEIQHIRSHPPSGDWRSVRGSAELIAAFCVPVGGFPIPRRALVASADGEITAIITAPLFVEEGMGYRKRMRKKRMLSQRLRELVGPAVGPREQMRRDAIAHKE